MKLPFLYTLEAVAGYWAQAEHHTLLMEGITSFVVTPLSLCVYKSVAFLISLIVCLGWEPGDKPENALLCYVGICGLWVAGYVIC